MFSDLLLWMVPFILAIMVALVVWIIGYIAIIFFCRWLKKSFIRPYDHIDAIPHNERALRFITTVVYYVLLFFLFVLCLDILGLQLSLLIGGLGLGVTFALEHTMQNIVAAILLSTNPHIRQKECLFFGGSLQIVGLIERIGARYTVIRTENMSTYIVANRILAKQPIQRWMHRPYIRYEVRWTSDCVYPVTDIIAAVTTAFRDYSHCVAPELTHVVLEGVGDGVCMFVGYCFCEPISEIDNMYIDDHKPEVVSELLAIVYTQYRAHDRAIGQVPTVVEISA